MASQQNIPDVDKLGASSEAKDYKVGILIVVLVFVVIGFGAQMWWRSVHYVETDNAFVTGHLHIVSPRINGVVSKVLVDDNQYVQEGEVIVELDSTDQLTKIEQIQAQIDSAKLQVIRDEGLVNQAQAQVFGARALLNQAKALLKRGNQDTERYTRLYEAEHKAVSKAELEGVIAVQSTSTAEVEARTEVVRAAEANVVALSAASGLASAQVKVLEVQLKDARQFLSYHKVLAPVSGRVGKRVVEVGIAIQAGQHMAAVVEDNVWVTANFKETQLANIEKGQEVDIVVDAMKGRQLIGTIDSFSPASGAQFAMLPSDNATGNFTKIVQRVPVKIRLLKEDIRALDGRLVPGLSVQVKVRLDKPVVFKSSSDI